MNRWAGGGEDPIREKRLHTIAVHRLDRLRFDACRRCVGGRFSSPGGSPFDGGVEARVPNGAYGRERHDPHRVQRKPATP